MKFAIRLRSKYTGEEITLGSVYQTREAAEEAAERVCCSRCNSWSVVYVPEGSQWVNKHVGFVSREAM